MIDLILGIPTWIITSIILAIIEAPFIAKINENCTTEIKIMFMILTPMSFFLLPFVVLFIGIVSLIWKTPKYINNYIKNIKKEIVIDEPIEIFANFDSNSTIRYYSIEQGNQKVNIETNSVNIVLDIKECLERKEISWNDVKFDSGHYKSTVEKTVKEIKEKRIVNKIKL